MNPESSNANENPCGSAVLIGDKPMAESVQAVLKGIGWHVSRISAGTLALLAESNSNANLTAEVIRIKEDLNDCSAAITFPPYPLRVRSVVSLIHLLRGRFLEDSRLIAILDSQTDLAELKRWDLWGDPARRFKFGDLHGHGALSLPITSHSLLNEVQAAVASGGRMTFRTWNVELRSQSNLGKTQAKLVQFGKEFPGLTEKEQIQGIGEIMQEMIRLNWNHELCSTHAAANQAAEFLRPFREGKRIARPELPDLIKRATAVFENSMAGLVYAQSAENQNSGGGG